MHETVHKFSAHVQRSAGFVHTVDVVTPAQELPRFPQACDTIPWNSVVAGSAEVRDKFPKCFAFRDTLQSFVGRMFGPGVVETIEVVQSAKIAGFLPPGLEAMCVHRNVPGLCAQVSATDPRYVRDIYATGQYGATKSRKYSFVGYKVHDHDGTEYIKYGKCAMFFRLKDRRVCGRTINCS